MSSTKCISSSFASGQNFFLFSTAPQFFLAYPACTHRLIPWLTRDLKVLLNDEESHVNFVLQIILSLITKYVISFIIIDISPFSLLQLYVTSVKLSNMALTYFKPVSFTVNCLVACIAGIIGEGRASKRVRRKGGLAFHLSLFLAPLPPPQLRLLCRLQC